MSDTEWEPRAYEEDAGALGPAPPTRCPARPGTHCLTPGLLDAALCPGPSGFSKRREGSTVSQNVPSSEGPGDPKRP